MNAPAALALPQHFADWFAGRGWAPHPHQQEMLAAVQDGRDALLIAPTGAGKTLAGFLPSLIDLAGRGSLERDFGGPAHPLHLAPQGAGGRYRAQPGSAGARDGARHTLRDPDRRHAAREAHAPAQAAAGHPDDDAGIPVPAADLCRRGPPARPATLPDRRRVACPDAEQARRPAGPRHGAARHPGARGPPDRPVGNGAQRGRGAALDRRRTPGTPPLAKRCGSCARHRARNRTFPSSNPRRAFPGPAIWRCMPCRRSTRKSGRTGRRWSSSTRAARPRSCSASSGA